MNSKLNTFIFLLAILLSTSKRTDAQSTAYPCAASEMQRNLFEKMPLQLRLHEQIEEQIHQHQLRNAERKELRSGMPFTIPVVVHIVHQNGAENISDAQVQQAIQNLNDAFAQKGHYAKLGKGVSIPVQFCLAQRTPDNRATTGITRTESQFTNMNMESEDWDLKNLVRWDPLQYVNVWVVKEITSQVNGPGVAGYAFYASAHGSIVDGIVCESSYFGSSPSNDAVLIHEIGHYLNLYHTFERGCTNDRCDLEGDRVCDTPPDQAKHTGCVFNSCDTDAKDTRNINPLKTDVNDLTENFMDYSPFTCQYTFTQGQADRMLAALQTVRMSLLESPGCLLPCTTTISADFSVPDSIVVDKEVTFTYKGVGGLKFEWSINNKVVSNQRNLSYTFTKLGNHSIELKVIGDSENCFAKYRLQATVFCNLRVRFNNAPQEIKEGQSLRFIGNSSGATLLKWTVDGITVGTGPQLDYSFNQSKVYFVVLTADNGFCSSTVSGTVKVKSPCGDSLLQYRYLSDQNLAVRTYQLPGEEMICIGQALGRENQFIMRLNRDGTIKWAKEANAVSGDNNGGFCVLADGNYAILTTSGTPINTALMKMSPDGEVLWVKQYANWGLNVQVFSATAGKILIHTTTRLIMVDQDGNQIWERGLSGTLQFQGVAKRNDNTFFVTITGSRFLILDENGQTRLERRLSMSFNRAVNYPVCLPDNGIVLVFPEQRLVYIVRLDADLQVLWAKRVNRYDMNAHIARNQAGDLLFSMNRGRAATFSAISAEGVKLWTVSNNAVSFSETRSPATAYRNGWAAPIVSFDGLFILHIPNLSVPNTCFFQADTLTLTDVSMSTGSGRTALETISPEQALPSTMNFIAKKVEAIAYCQMPIKCPESCGDTIVQNFYQGGAPFNSKPYPLSDGGRVLIGGGTSSPDLLISKLDKDGAVRWTKRILLAISPSSKFVELSDGSFVIAYAQVGRVNLLKMNRDGQVIWSKFFLSSFATVTELLKDQNNGLYLLAFREIHRIDPNGQIVWTKTAPIFHDFNALTMLSNGQLLCTMYSSTTRSRIFAHLDSNGDFSKQQQIAIDTGPTLIEALPEGGVLAFVRQSNPYKKLLLRLDANLNVVWSKTPDLEPVFLAANFEGMIMYGIQSQRETLLVLLGLDGRMLWAAKANGDIPPTAIGTGYAEGWMLNLNTPGGTHNVIIPNAEFPNACYFTEAESGLFDEPIQSTAATQVILDDQLTITRDFFDLQISDDRLFRTIHCKTTRPCPEICDNQLDDNNDGLIDCKDPTCQCDLCAELPDGLISALDSLQCMGDSLKVFLKVCNQGKAVLLANTPLAFYDGNPTQVNANPLASIQRLGINIKTDTCAQLVFHIKIPAEDSIFVALNDDYRRRRPYAFRDPSSTDQFPECSYRNNLFSFQHRVRSSPKLDLGPDLLVCENGVTPLKTPPGFNRYRWPDGSTDTTFTASSPGIFWLDAWDVCGNKQSDTIRLNLRPLGKVDLGPNRTICEGDSVVLNVNGFEKVTWWPNEKLSCVDCKTTSIKPDVSRLYLVTARTGNCFAGDSIYLKVEKRPQVNLGRDRDTCDASSIQLTTVIEPNVTYTWNTGVTGPNLLVNTSGQYSLKAEREGCQNQDSVQVRFSERPKFSLGRDTSFCEGQKLTLAPNPARNGQYTWSNGANTPSIEATQAGTYSLRIRQNNCEWTDTLVLKSEDCLAFAVYVPNVFSPNSLVNGEFKPFFSTQTQVLDYQFAIYDRWGGIVFSTKNPEQGWKGENKGVQCGQGVYVWRLNVRYQTAKNEEQTKQQVGEVLLLR
jgi:PKD repeat protein